MKAPPVLYYCPGCARVGVTPDFRRHSNCEGTPVKYVRATHLRAVA